MKATTWQLGLIALFILILLLFSLGGCMVSKEKVAVIPLEGVIAGTGNRGLLTTAGINPGLVRDYLKRAENDASVKAIVLHINSPGGSAAASQEIASDIRHFKENTGKPVVVSMADIAASGGYYISVYADKIVANPGTLTGSIGVINYFIYVEGLLEKLGLEMEIIKAGKHKDMGIRHLTEEERQIMQDLTNNLYKQFVTEVAGGRKLPLADVESLATGQIYTGTQALEAGLVDELGGLNRSVDLAASLAGVIAPEIEEYGRPTSFSERLFGQLSQSLPRLFSGDELLLLRILEGWQGMPQY